MRSLAEVAADRHRFVLLGRRTHLDDVWLDLADCDIDTEWYEISHFDAEQRRTYFDAARGKPRIQHFERGLPTSPRGRAGTDDPPQRALGERSLRR